MKNESGFPESHPVRRRRGERGSHIVEAGLTLTFLVAVVIGFFDFGWVLFLNQSMAHLARAGARYAVVHPQECDATHCDSAENIILYGTKTGRGGNGAYGLQRSNVSVVRLGAPNTSEDRVQATISGYSYSFLTPLFGLGGTKSINVRVTLPVENTYGL